MTKLLEDRTAIVTGGSQGLGLAIATHFVAEGANVVLCARDSGKLAVAVNELRQHVVLPQKVIGLSVDVSDETAVNRFVMAITAEFDSIDILVNSAGVYGPMGLIEEIDWQEWVDAIKINLLGTVQMCRAVLPYMKKAHFGKIINLSGGGATAPMPRISAYAASKAAVVRFTESLALECKDDGIDVNAIAPGALNTRLLDQVLAAGPGAVGEEFYQKSVAQNQSGGTPLERGVELCTFLASAVSNGITGKLISAVWDPWASLPARKQEVQESDIYTLRRIVPKDRGKEWDLP
ncbi:MAG: family oxidoreductase [Firmicutes bacterium]|nr:family oxidoreductase [Bacillota bacterium]